MQIFHRARTDEKGNFKSRSRMEEGYLGRIDEDHPFPALVTAWYPKSQTMDVSRPISNGLIEYQGVVVYGNFFEETGTIQTPKIATEKKIQDITTIRNPNSSNADPTSDNYVLDNHIEALVYKISVGNGYGFAASSFRFLNPSSVLLNNSKPGRKIVRHDDGSYYIHDADGNIQFRHPSGLKLRAGKTLNDMDLDIPFPTHEKNSIDYGGEIVARLEHPSGSYSEYTAAGTINIVSAEDINLSAIGNINLEANNINSDATTKIKDTSPDIEENASSFFYVDSPESEMTGNLTIGGMIEAVGDIIADWMTTAISLINHLTLGDLGYNTSKPLPGASAGTPGPGSSPSYDSGTNIADLHGMDLKNVGAMSEPVSDHTHNFTAPAEGESGTTLGPN